MELVSCLVDLVLATVVGVQQLLGHLVHIIDTSA